MCRSQIDRAPRLRDDRGIPEVPLESLVMGAESPRPTGKREPDHMAVVGLAEPGLLQLRFTLLHRLIRDLPRSTCLQQSPYKAARGIQPVQFSRQVTAYDQAAISLLEPVQDGHEVRMWRPGKDGGCQVRVNDQAHSSASQKSPFLFQEEVAIPGRCVDDVSMLVQFKAMDLGLSVVTLKIEQRHVFGP